MTSPLGGKSKEQQGVTEVACCPYFFAVIISSSSSMSYFDFFVSNANNGYVFDTDMSSLATARPPHSKRGKGTTKLEQNLFHHQGPLLWQATDTPAGNIKRRSLAAKVDCSPNGANGCSKRTGVTEVSREGRMYI